VNKVLEEGLRLKQTCKLLKAQLHDVETQRAAEHEAHERYIAKREREFKEEMSKAVSGLAIECARLRDSNSAEIEDLNRQINVLKYEAARKEAKAATERDESSSTTTCQTIAALEIEIAALKDEILAVREDKERELAMMRHEYEAEKKAYIMRREEALDDQRSAMLRRALIAENESQRLLSELSNAETKVRRLQEEICGAQQTRYEHTCILRRTHKIVSPWILYSKFKLCIFCLSSHIHSTKSNYYIHRCTYTASGLSSLIPVH
jgi:hypothetical protein